MMHSVGTLYDELAKTLREIDKQAEHTSNRLITDINNGMYVEDTTVYDIQGPDGHHILTPFIVARAQVVSAMAQLKATTMSPPGKGKW